MIGRIDDARKCVSGDMFRDSKSIGTAEKLAISICVGQEQKETDRTKSSRRNGDRGRDGDRERERERETDRASNMKR